MSLRSFGRGGIGLAFMNPRGEVFTMMAVALISPGGEAAVARLPNARRGRAAHPFPAGLALGCRARSGLAAWTPQSAGVQRMIEARVDYA
jgi:hypothetical protein